MKQFYINLRNQIPDFVSEQMAVSSWDGQFCKIIFPSWCLLSILAGWQKQLPMNVLLIIA